MDQNLRDAFEKFKFYTLDFMERLKNDDYDALGNLVAKRQEILNSIEKMHYSAEECHALEKDLKILDLEKKLSELTLEKKRDLIEKMESVEKTIASNNSYNSMVHNPLFFSGKI